MPFFFPPRNTFLFPFLSSPSSCSPRRHSILTTAVACGLLGGKGGGILLPKTRRALQLRRSQAGRRSAPFSSVVSFSILCTALLSLSLSKRVSDLGHFIPKPSLPTKTMCRVVAFVFPKPLAPRTPFDAHWTGAVCSLLGADVLCCSQKNSPLFVFAPQFPS